MRDGAVSEGRDGTAVVPAAGVWRCRGRSGLLGPSGRLVRWVALAAVAVLVAGAVPAGAQSTDPPDDPPPAADDASLSSLSLSGVDFGGFSSGVAGYAANVAGDVSVTTVTATAANSAAEVSILPGDADEETDGHQVGLIRGRNWVRVSVTSADGNVQQLYEVVVVRDPGEAMSRNADADISIHGDPPRRAMAYFKGVWGINDRLMLISNGGDLYDECLIQSYDLATGLPLDPRLLDDPFLPTCNPFPKKLEIESGAWSDGEILWVSYLHQKVIRAYDLKTGALLPERHISTRSAKSGSQLLRGVWSDGETIWVAENYALKVFAFDLATGERRPDADIALETGADRADAGLAERYKIFGLWSDGKTMWVGEGHGGPGLYQGPRHIWAYDLATGERKSDLDLLNPLGSTYVGDNMAGFWSDGTTMWVSETRWAESIRAFNMPASALLAWLQLSDADIPFSADRFDYDAVVPLETSQVTLSAAAAFSSSEVSFSAADADAEVGGVQVDLVEGLNTVVVTSANGDDTRTYTLRVYRGDPPPPPPPPLPFSAELSSLAVSGVELTFSADQLIYEAQVGADVESVTVSAVAADERASVTVLPVDTDPGTDAHEVSLSSDANVVTITVRAGEEILTYTVVLTRPADDSADGDDAVGGKSDSDGDGGEGPVSLQQEEPEELADAEQRSESESDGSESVGPPLTASFEELPDAHGGAGADLVVRVRFSEPLAVSYVTMRDGWALFVGSPHELIGARRVDGASDLWEFTVRVGDDERLRLTVFKGTGCDGRHAVCTADGRPVSKSVLVFVEGPDSGDSGDDAGEQQAPEQQAPEARAENEIGAVSLSSGAAGELTISWEAPGLAPFEYRVMWARDDLDHLPYWQPDEAHRGNAWPTGDATSVTLAGLEEGAAYKVQIRARFRDEKGEVSASPWTNETTATVTVAPPP